MAQLDPSDQRRPVDITPAAGGGTGNGPPPLPPHLCGPPKRRKRNPWIIVAIIFGCVLLLIATVSVAIALIVFSQLRSPRARSPHSQRISAEIAQRSAREAGLSYTNERVARVPWSIHVLKIDRSRKDLMFFAALANDRILGVSLIADQAQALRPEFGSAIAGINGDYYERDNPTYAGDPRGLQIVNGELVSAPDTVSVWFDADGNPHLDHVKDSFQITWPGGHKTPFGLNERRSSESVVLYTPTYGASTRAHGGQELILEPEGQGPWLPLRAGQVYRARVREIRSEGNTRLTPDFMVLSIPSHLRDPRLEVRAGAVLEIATATMPKLTGVRTAIGGGPALIKNGKAVPLPRGSNSGHYSERSKYERHPRSAVGWNETDVFLVIVDGRQPGLSVGMKLAELTDYMLRLGCTEGMAFDGGKSAQMWLAGRIVNSPAHGEDTVANSLLVVRKPR